MNPEVICIDEDYDSQLHYVTLPTRSNQMRTRSSRVGTKRSYDGVTIQSIHEQNSQTTYTTSDGIVLSEIAVDSSAVVGHIEEPSDVIVDGPDVYIIEEIDGPETSLPAELYNEVQWSTDNLQTAGTSQQRTELEPTTSVSVYVEDSDDEPQPEAVVPEKEIPQIDDYYEVEPLELSEVWNDLITANQEILILLELQDLRHHIVDARKIEDQFTAMACEYCPKELVDVRAWNRHIKKIHFQTEEFTCDCCPAKFKYYARFKDHLNGHSGLRPYKCDECDHEYAFRISFLVHKILEHMKLNGIYVCPKCALDCKNAQNYKLHIAKHIDNTSTSNGHSQNLNGHTPRVSTTVTTSYVKPGEHDKFLNVFEKFSKKRDEGFAKTLPNTIAPKRKPK